jgi:thioester reductase-like protein
VLRKKYSSQNIFDRFISTLLCLGLPHWSSEESIIASFASIDNISAQSTTTSCLTQLQSSGATKPRIILLEGDLSEDMFSLSSDVYEGLLSRITHCVDACGLTSFRASYLQVRSANVLSTQQLIQFLNESHQSIRLVFLSSLSASLHPTLPAFEPYHLNLSQAHQAITQHINNHNETIGDDDDGNWTSVGYPLSKMIAEYLISCHCQGQQKISFVSLQLGTISSHCLSGYSNLTDVTTRLIHSLMSRLVPPPHLEREWCRGTIDLLSVEFIGQVVELLIARDCYNNQITPIYTSHPTSFYDLLTETRTHLLAVQHDHKRSEMVSFDEWIETLSLPLYSGDPLAPLAPLLGELFLSPDRTLGTSGEFKSKDAEEEDRDAPIGTVRFRLTMRELQEAAREFDAKAMVPLIVRWICQQEESRSRARRMKGG